MDETVLKRNSLPQSSPCYAVGKSEVKKRLPLPPPSSDQSQYESIENDDMVTYVPPLTATQQQLSETHSTKLYYSGCESNITDNSPLVVKPIENKNGTLTSTVFRQHIPITTRSETTYPSSTRPVHSQQIPRTLPQVPKQSAVGNRHQLPVPFGNIKNNISQNEINLAPSCTPSHLNFATCNNGGFDAANAQTKQYIPPPSKQYPSNQHPTGNGHTFLHPLTGQRNSQRTSSLTTLYQQRNGCHPQPSQINLVKPSTTTNFLSHQEYSNINGMDSSKSTNIQSPSQTPPNMSITRYRCPPP
jgi:hypothetical protein